MSSSAVTPEAFIVDTRASSRQAAQKLLAVWPSSARYPRNFQTTLKGDWMADQLAFGRRRIYGGGKMIDARKLMVSKSFRGGTRFWRSQHWRLKCNSYSPDLKERLVSRCCVTWLVSTWRQSIISYCQMSRRNRNTKLPTGSPLYCA